MSCLRNYNLELPVNIVIRIIPAIAVLLKTSLKVKIFIFLPIQSSTSNYKGLRAKLANPNLNSFISHNFYRNYDFFIIEAHWNMLCIFLLLCTILSFFYSTSYKSSLQQGFLIKWSVTAFRFKSKLQNILMIYINLCQSSISTFL